MSEILIFVLFVIFEWIAHPNSKISIQALNIFLQYKKNLL